MTETLAVHLFVEDVAHDRWLQALVRRVAAEQGASVDLSVRAARGGRGAVLTEVQLAQRSASGQRPDLLVVGVDANCEGDRLRRKVQALLDATYCPRQLVACPDPHVERWYLADPAALKVTLGVSAELPAVKCERDLYKQVLLNALVAAGHNVTLGGAEFADEIVEAMDLFRAGKNDASLKHCIDDLRAALKELA
jgi:hypothetical protein